MLISIFKTGSSLNVMPLQWEFCPPQAQPTASGYVQWHCKRAGTAHWPDRDSAPALSASKTRAHRVRAFLKANEPCRGSFRSCYFFDGSAVASFTFERILRRGCAIGLISINASLIRANVAQTFGVINIGRRGRHLVD